MNRVPQKAIDDAIARTSDRLKKVAATASHGDDPLRDVIMILSRLMVKLGADDLADQLDDFLIGYTNPEAEDLKVAS